jgi:type I restriction enzyme M protein
MITGEIRNKIDQIWDTFWTGGIASPISVIEQMTYLLFIKGLDEAQARKERQARLLDTPIKNPIFTESQQHLRWSRFKNLEPRAMYDCLSKEVFPFIKNLQGEESAFAAHMRDAIFMIPPEKAGLLARVVDMLDAIPMEDRDTKGDLYEYMLGKLSQAGDSGQFRTPRHIIGLMTEMIEPRTDDVICDPACGTAGMIVSVAEYFNQPDRLHLFHEESFRDHFHHRMFHGFDFDSTMLRIACMNLLLHGLEKPIIVNRDSLSEDHAGEEEKYSVIMANPPFAGSLDYEACAKDLLQIVKTKKTELLFLALFLRLLKPGGRAAVIVPDGVLFGSSKAHRTIRENLVDHQKLEAVISMPSGVFKPYAGVSTAILFFTRTDSGGTDHVLFYDIKADGFSLDDKRTPLLPDDKRRLHAELSPEEHAKCNLPDVLTQWRKWKTDGESGEFSNRTAQCFAVPKADIVANNYDLSLNRYKEIIHEEVQHRPPTEILASLNKIEDEIQQGLKELETMLK